MSFAVLDRGPGLTGAECAQAVQRFWRRGKAGSGSGLGLSIVRSIDGRCGGEFTLRPRGRRAERRADGERAAAK